MRQVHLDLTRRQLDVDAMKWLDDPQGGKSARDDFRQKLTAGAELFIYGCHGGQGQGLLLCMDISMTLNLAVRSFRDPVQFDPRSLPWWRSPARRITS